MNHYVLNKNTNNLTIYKYHSSVPGNAKYIKRIHNKYVNGVLYGIDIEYTEPIIGMLIISNENLDNIYLYDEYTNLNINNGHSYGIGVEDDTIPYVIFKDNSNDFKFDVRINNNGVSTDFMIDTTDNIAKIDDAYLADKGGSSSLIYKYKGMYIVEGYEPTNETTIVE